MMEPRSVVGRSSIAAVLFALLWLASCSSQSAPPITAEPTASNPQVSAPASGLPSAVRVAGTVVSTAGSSNEAQVVIPAPIVQSWTALGSAGSGLEWISVAGDARASRQTADLNAAAIGKLAEKMNALQAQSSGRSALAGLAAITSPAGSPIWVFSPLLDTEGALNFNSLAFDQSPPTVIQALTRAGRIPNLKGRNVTFVVTPEAGAQKKLSQLQVGYLHAVWEGLARAGGATKVTFFNGTGETPGTGTIRPIAVPNPRDRINSAAVGKTRTCTLPAPALFVPDEATLIDKNATLGALGQCVGTLAATTKITVEGHTAASPGGDEQSAKDLSTRRATEVAALLRELKVPAKNITRVVGYGDTKPLVEPAADPANRAVVVTFTTTG